MTGLLLAAALMCSSSTYSSAQNCRPVGTMPAGSGFRGDVIPIGKYCLTTDLKQSREFDLHAGRFLTYVGVPLLTITYIHLLGLPDFSSGNITEVNLQNHEIRANVDDMRGIRDTIPSKHLFIHDGKILVPGNDKHNIGIDLQAMSSPRETYARPNCKTQRAACEEMPTAHRDAPPYQATEHVVQKVDVRAGWLGVQMVGIGNTLRDSVIEVDSRSAIALFGPGSRIENNTIIVHGKSDPTPEDGAITLWDGSGAIIRNNRFIFKGSFKKAPPAIRLVDSANVQLEGNTFDGFDVQVEPVGTTTYRFIQ